MARFSSSQTLKCWLCVLLSLIGFFSLVLASRPVLAQSTLHRLVNANSLIVADDTEGGLITEVVDDRAIKQLISSQAENLLPDPTVSLLSGFGEQINRTSTKLKLPRIRTSELESDEVYPAVAPSVLVLSKVYKCGRCTRWHDRSAGAFAITADGVIVTNHHVVASPKPDEKALVATAANGKVYVVKEILAANKLNDVAILKLDMPAGEKLTPARIADRAIPGENVYVISHPVSRFYTLTKGVVSRNAMMHTPAGSSRRLYITAEFAKGSSGSPIFNGRGEVVGIVSSTQSIYYTQTGEEQKNLQMVFRNCVPAASVYSLLK